MSFRSSVAPLVMRLDGGKRLYRSSERILERIAKARLKPQVETPPKSLSSKVDSVRRVGAQWPVWDFSPKGAAPTDKRIMYLHGGTYSFEMHPFQWRLIGNLVRETGAKLVLPIMPLAPEGTASQIVPIVADMVAALIDEVGAGNVTIMGDSSGGGMALAVAMVLRDRGLPPLGNTILVSPWLDISGTDPQLAVIDPLDPWLAVPGTIAAGNLYRAELPNDDPMVSPINGSLAGLGPVTMFSGTRDILNADATRFAALATKAGLPLDYHEGAGQIHNYPLAPMPEGDTARKVMVAAITAA